MLLNIISLSLSIHHENKQFLRGLSDSTIMRVQPVIVACIMWLFLLHTFIHTLSD